MNPLPSAVRMWLPVGHKDMRKASDELALLVQEKLRQKTAPQPAALGRQPGRPAYTQAVRRLNRSFALRDSPA
jgi:hypothetical protein